MQALRAAEQELPAGRPAARRSLEISANDLDTLHAQLSDAGLRPDGPPEDRPWGERSFFMSDPDGNTIELAAG